MSKEPLRILRQEMYVGMGLSAYLLTDFTIKTMSPVQAEKMGWWKHGVHPSPILESQRLVLLHESNE